MYKKLKIDKFKNLRKNVLFKNISYLTIGKGISQIISLIGAFYIPKLLGTESYGIYQTIINYINLFLFFTLTGFDKVAIRESSRSINKNKEILESLLGLKYLFSIIGIIISILTLFFIDYQHTTKIYISIFSITILFKSLHKALYVIYKAHEKMQIVAIFDIIQPILIVTTGITLIKLGHGVFELIISNVIIVFIITLFNYIYSKNFFRIHLLPRRKVIKQYVRPGINFSILDLLNTLSTRIDIFMLSLLTTPVNVGIYALAYRMFEKANSLRNSISQSLLPNYTKKYEKNKLNKNELYKHSLLILIFSIFVIIIVNISSKPIITNIIGNEYMRSAKIINILIFNFAIIFTSIPWSIQLQVSKNEKLLININLIRAFLNISLNFLLFQLIGLIGIAYSTVISTLFFSLLIFYFVNKKI